MKRTTYLMAVVILAELLTIWTGRLRNRREAELRNTDAMANSYVENSNGDRFFVWPDICSSLQKAIDGLPSTGGDIKLPRGEFPVCSAGLPILNKPISVSGTPISFTTEPEQQR